jgi:hypothetical protein
MSLSVIYEIIHDSVWPKSKQDYGSPKGLSMQVKMPGHCTPPFRVVTNIRAECRLSRVVERVIAAQIAFIE